MKNISMIVVSAFCLVAFIPTLLAVDDVPAGKCDIPLIRKVPEEFNLIIRKKYSGNEIVFNMRQGTLKAYYGKEYIVRGEKIDTKTINTNLKSEDMVLIYEYIVRSQVFSIKEEKLNPLGAIRRYPSIHTIFKIVLKEDNKYYLLECDVENLLLFNPAETNQSLNKLWNLYHIVNLILKLRCNETIDFNNWLWYDLEDRIKRAVDCGNIYENDHLPDSALNSELKCLAKYKTLLEKRKKAILSETEQFSYDFFHKHFYENWVNYAELPYKGMNVFTLATDNRNNFDIAEKAQYVKDSLDFLKKIQSLKVMTKEEKHEFLKLYEEFLESQKEQADDVLYRELK